MLCPIFNSNRIELTVHTSCYCGLRLSLCSEIQGVCFNVYLLLDPNYMDFKLLNYDNSPTRFARKGITTICPYFTQYNLHNLCFGVCSTSFLN